MFDDSQDIMQLWTTHICFAQPHKISVVYYQIYFQKFLMPEHKDRVFLLFSFEIEEEYPIFENQFDSA